jgi:hypothetical protein
MPSEEGAAKEVAAAHAFQMEVESNALVSFREADPRDELTFDLGPSCRRSLTAHA